MVDGNKPPKDKGLEGGSSTENYKCNALWRQFDALIDLPGCSCDAALKVKEHSQLLRLMQFLMRLDDMFSFMRSLIMTTEPFPDVKGSNIMCKQTRHTIDRCFELVSYPSGLKSSNDGQNNSNNATSNDIKTDHNKSAPHTLTNDR
ncbi:hypothetical protein Tco_0178986 [Tanacetum coccineum]